MKIFRKIMIIFVPLLILGSFIVFWVEPKFNLWQMDKSIVFKRQELPLIAMFLVERKDNVFMVPITLPQFVFAGPEETLFSGLYQYKIKIIPNCSDKDLGYMDIVKNNGNLGLGAKEIIAQKEGQEQTESLEFKADTTFDYEFRFYSKGECSFEIKEVWLEREKIDFKGFLLTVWQKVQSVIK